MRRARGEKNVILSERFGDLTNNQEWRPEGCTVKDTQEIYNISIVKDKTRNKIRTILKEINLKLSLKKNFR